MNWFKKRRISKLTNCPEYGFNGFNGYGLIKSVYDGDTLKIATILPGMNDGRIINCRMDGYDSPELKPSRNLPNRDEYIIKAYSSRDKLASYIGKTVHIHIKGFDKYGRFLVVLRECGVKNTINDIMIRDGFGVEYHGGTK